MSNEGTKSCAGVDVEGGTRAAKAQAHVQVNSKNHKCVVHWTVVKLPIPIRMHVGTIQHKKRVSIVNLGQSPNQVVVPIHLVFKEVGPQSGVHTTSRAPS